MKHHHPDGGFTDPWAAVDRGTRNRDGRGAFLRWRWERFRDGIDPTPPPEALPIVDSAIARPHAPADELRITWVGHSTLLVQIGGANLLTDPVWSKRVSPVSWAGPARLVPAAPAFDALPPIDAVLISHDHFDHLDKPTIARLAEAHADAHWFTPLGYRTWLGRRGIRRVTELDWWQAGDFLPRATSATNGAGPFRVTAAPARHWTARNPFITGTRLWASWAVHAPGGARFYFGGDSGYFPGYGEIGERLGPFDAAALPIGAYAPSWFMETVHMNPEQALQAWRELGGQGALVATHWGTFRLADEPVLEPPARMRAAWGEAALSEDDLWIHRHGETRARTLVPDGARA